MSKILSPTQQRSRSLLRYRSRPFPRNLSSQVWQLVSWLEDRVIRSNFRPDYREWPQKLRHTARHCTQPSGWVGAALLGLAIALNGRLLLTTGASIGAIALCLWLAQQKSAKLPWSPFNRRVRRRPRLSQPSIAAVHPETYPLTHWLTQLTDPNPLHRLIAIRQSTQHALSGTDSIAESIPSDRAYLAACFRLMLQTETDPTLRQALQQHLQPLEALPPLKSSIAPLVQVSPLHLPETRILEASTQID